MTIELYFLPEDVLFIVWDFIKDTDKISWCKQFFYRYHQELYREKFLFNNNYLFFIIRSDLFFILENLLLENSQELTKKSSVFHTKMYHSFRKFLSSTIMQMLLDKTNVTIKQQCL